MEPSFRRRAIYLHAADRQWIMRPDKAIVFWGGDTRTLAGGLTLVRCGGHFEGGTVLHWEGGAEGRGALLSGDIIQGAFWDMVIGRDGKTVVKRSAQRYLRAIGK